MKKNLTIYVDYVDSKPKYKIKVDNCVTIYLADTLIDCFDFILKIGKYNEDVLTIGKNNTPFAEWVTNIIHEETKLKVKFGFYLNSFENSGGQIFIHDATLQNINNQIFTLLTNGDYDNFVSIDEANTIAKWAETAQINDDFTTNDFTIWREE